MAINQVADALAGSGSTFASDNDPELVKQAVPFSLKLMESILAENPRHVGLLTGLCSGFTQYGYAFVQEEADEREARDYATAEVQRIRAKKLFLRARDYGLAGLDVAHAGFSRSLAGNPRSGVLMAGKADVPLLFWTAAAWGSAISLGKNDPALLADIPQMEALIDRALELDETWNEGAVHEFLITYEMARQGVSGNPAERATVHFDRALQLSHGSRAGVYVAYAEAVCVEKQQAVKFEQLLQQALAIDPDAHPLSRLSNLVMQQRARWLLGRKMDLFLKPPLPDRPHYNRTTSMLFHSFLRTVAFLIGLSAASLSLEGATTIKLGTLVPVGTSYYKILMQMGENWKKDSGGSIDLKIFAGGKAGGESEMVGLSMENNLQAAMLTVVGLSEIEPSVKAIQFLPMEFRSLDEVDFVIQRLRPILDDRLAKKGFVVLFWSEGGWIRIFSKSLVKQPDDLKKLKLFAWAGDVEQVSLMRSAGFNPVPIETADIVPNLQTGLIEAVPLPPFFALASQVDVRAPYMLAINWAPLVGACVVRKETWEKIPPDTRLKLLASAAQAGLDTIAVAHRESDESVKAMEKRGLKVEAGTPEIQQNWQTFAETMYPKIRGHLVPADVFDETLKLVSEYRTTHAP